MKFDIIIVGAGVFGVTAAIELCERGFKTALVDPGPIPHPLAATTDISKVIRLAYGKDEEYMHLAEKAIDGWRKWNESFEKPLYHEIGVLMLSRELMTPGDFEYESFQLLKKRGHHPERMNQDEIIKRFPAWKDAGYKDGFYHHKGGYAESGKVLSALVQKAKHAGVIVKEGFKVSQLLLEKESIQGVKSVYGEILLSKTIVIAAGAWTPLLVPALANMMKASGHPVFHLKAENSTLFQEDNFPVFTADISKTGWYGFPVYPAEQVIKIAIHSKGLLLHPEKDERLVTKNDEVLLRDFIKRTFPMLVDSEIVYSRRCLYCDTLDEHFLIDQHPDIGNLFVASGGSGHGFKFAPVLGDLIADAVQGKSNPFLKKFRWRTLPLETKGEEASRFH